MADGVSGVLGVTRERESHQNIILNKSKQKQLHKLKLEKI